MSLSRKDKLNDFCDTLNLHVSNYDVIVIIESWLHKGNLDAELYN